MFKNMEVISQFPSLSESELEDTARRLTTRFGYDHFPSQYGQFLRENNGCFFQAKDEESEVCVDLDLPFMNSTLVAGIFGVWFESFEGLEPLNKEWPELFASNENSKENFDVLPDNMMSFAYEGEGSGSLFAISTDIRDAGNVYYYYDEYLYSIIGRKRMLEQYGYCYFDRKLKQTLSRHNLDITALEEIDKSRQLEPGMVIDLLGGVSADCEFELNRNSFVLVANSFDEFLGKLKVEEA
ncbi:MAG: hypothetical protein OQJ89_12860 [Kangiellaceae bacterium]|nr:hypothetical protein [Kangiellaceae bacterium]MCW9017853.1 hypothetical protein [Kangiellaceae bacterium]